MPLSTDELAIQMDSPSPGRLNAFVQNLGLAVAYLVFAQLGQLLGLSPDNISLFGPSSALALCAILYYGLHLWPGIWLGMALHYLLLSLPVSASEQWLAISWVCASLATTAVVQAVVVRYLINRTVDINAALIHNQDILRVLAYAGPIGGLIGASLGSLILLMAGQIEHPHLIIHWGTWWFSDSLVTVIMLPLLLIVLGKPRSIWRQRTFSVATPLLAAVLVTMTTVYFVQQEEQRHTQSEFREKAFLLSEALEKILLKNIEVLYSIQNLFNTGGTVQREQFDSFVQRSLDRNPGIKALGWNPVVTRPQRHQFEQDVQQEGFVNFHITERSATGELVAAGDRERHVVVKYLVPMQGNEKAFGYDVYSNDSRRKALDKASQSGALVATAPIQLVQETGNQAGVLFMLPVYEGVSSPPVNQRYQGVRGFVVGVFRLGDLVKEALTGLSMQNIQVSLIDVTDVNHAKPLAYFGFEQNGHGLPLPSSTDDMKTSQLAWQSTLKFGQRDWQFKVYETAQYLRDNREWTSWFILAIGMLFSSLIGAFALIITGRNIIDLATMDSLSVEIGKRKHAEAELRKLNRELEKLASTDPLTGIHNRRSIESIGRTLESEARRYSENYSVFLLDVDHFKKVNDKHGHKVGDQVLQTLVQRIQRQLRETDSLGRWGGEEFVIIARHIKHAQAVQFAQRLVDNVAHLDIEQVGQITISLGVANALPSESFEDVVHRADTAMYKAKMAGRNSVEVSAPPQKQKTATMIKLNPR